MVYSGARGTLIYEKNLKSKFSCQTPFNASYQFDVASALYLTVKNASYCQLSRSPPAQAVIYTIYLPDPSCCLVCNLLYCQLPKLPFHYTLYLKASYPYCHVTCLVAIHRTLLPATVVAICPILLPATYGHMGMAYIGCHFPYLLASYPGHHWPKLIVIWLPSALSYRQLPRSSPGLNWFSSTLPYCQLPELPSVVPHNQRPLFQPDLLGCNLPNLIATYPCCHLTYCNLPYLISSYPDCHEPYRITSFPRYHLSYLVQSTLNLIASYPGCHLPYLIASFHWPTCYNLTYLVASYPGCHLPFLQCIKAPSDWTLQEFCPLFTEDKRQRKKKQCTYSS
jgi:hypothetical protein